MPDVTLVIFVSVIGVFFGSFLLLLADRLSNNRTILGRSHCESCKHTLVWYDLIPILSFSFLAAKCRYCQARLSFFYPMSEFASGILFGLTWYLSTTVYSSTHLHILHVCIAAVLFAIFLADLRYQIIPDELQIVLFLLAIIRLFFLIGFPVGFVEVSLWYEYVMGLVITTLPLLGLFIITKGKGMGFGDVKFAISMGLLLGWWGGLIALYLAFVSGGFFGVLFLLFRVKKLKSRIAFGPFLILGTYAVLFFELELMQFFLKVI